MINNLNLPTNKVVDPSITVPSLEEYYLSPSEYNTLVNKVKELIAAHNNLSSMVTTNVSFQSTVFRRTNTAPSTPIGGTYNSPIPTSTPQWYDGIPNGEEILWASNRIFTSDGGTPQQAGWSTPAQMTDTAEIDVEFSSLEYIDDDTPGNPTSNPNNWNNTGDSTTIWLAIAKRSNGSTIQPSDWTITRIKGENGADGMDYEFIFTQKITSEDPYDVSQLPAVDQIEYIPSSIYGVWTDNPAGVNAIQQYEWVSKRNRVAGVWGRFCKPALWSRYGRDGDGQSSFKSFVFQRSASILTTAPEGGTFLSPLPDPIGDWSDSIPSGQNSLWVSTRIFTADGLAPQEATWSVPVILADSQTLDVEYSKELIPEDPTTNALKWSNEADEETIWMAIAKLVPGIETVAADWQISRIKGEGGAGLSIATVALYQRAATIPANSIGTTTYTFATNVLSGSLSPWSQTIPSGTETIWIMVATATSTLSTDEITQGEWTTPVMLSTNGINLANIMLYQRSELKPTVENPTGDTIYTFATHTLAGTLGDWSTTVPPVNGLPVWMIAATAFGYNDTDTIASTDWSDPIMMMKDGDDGPGYESIFKLTTTNVAPATPASNDVDDYVPTAAGWFDNPQEVTSVNIYQWICKRSKSGGHWGNFSAPVIFNNYATSGTDGTPGTNGLSTANGLVHWQTSTLTSPGQPTATGYRFADNTFIVLKPGWLQNPPIYESGNSNAYWYCYYWVIDSGDGTGTVTFGTTTKAIGFTGLVTFTDLSTDGATQIHGSNVRTGLIQSTGYNGPDSGEEFSDLGMEIDLNNGKITSKNFYIDSSGNAKFKGSIESGASLATDGVFDLSEGSTIQALIMIMGGDDPGLALRIGDEGFYLRVPFTISNGVALSVLNGSYIDFSTYKLRSTGWDGDFVATGSASATAFYQTSDERKKTSISLINLFKLLNAKDIRFKQFKLISDKTETLRYGVIAQEIEDQFPELVQTNDKDEKTVDYTSLFALKIAALEGRIAILEAKLENK